MSHSQYRLLLLLGDTAKLLSAMAIVPEQVCSVQNGSLKVKPLTKAGTIRLHFIAMFHGESAWHWTRFSLPGGRK